MEAAATELVDAEALAGRVPTGEVVTAVDFDPKLYMTHGNWMVLTGSRELDHSRVMIPALVMELGKDGRAQEPRHAAPGRK